MKKLNNDLTICTICAMETVKRNKISDFDNRTFGWFPTECQAKKYLKKYPESIYACHNNYVVIEKFFSGLFPLAQEEWWYKWNRKKKIYEQIKKPKNLLHVINFGIG